MRIVSAFLMIGSFLAGPADSEEPQPGHVFFKCRLVINPSEGKTIPDAVIDDIEEWIRRAGKFDLAVPRSSRRCFGLRRGGK
jgi:hypothetical protein